MGVRREGGIDTAGAFLRDSQISPQLEIIGRIGEAAFKQYTGGCGIASVGQPLREETACGEGGRWMLLRDFKCVACAAGVAEMMLETAEG